jgi:hypothetical protein
MIFPFGPSSFGVVVGQWIFGQFVSKYLAGKFVAWFLSPGKSSAHDTTTTGPVVPVQHPAAGALDVAAQTLASAAAMSAVAAI